MFQVSFFCSIYLSRIFTDTYLFSRSCAMLWRRRSFGDRVDAHVEGGAGEHREGRQLWDDPWCGRVSLR